jgi:uncharacterized SAM-binding protein YcdF (DUF218 family)
VSAGATLFFLLSKLVGWFAIPSNTIGFVGLVGLLLMATRWRRAGRAFALASLALFVVCGFTPLGRVLALPLEQRFPAWTPTAEPPTGIIVLGGSISGRLSAARRVPVIDGPAERLTATVALARQYPHARLIYSGGSGSVVLRGAMEAQVARRLLVEMGIAPERIEVEERSRNTAENALFSKAIARPKPGDRWLLVTSAMHMPRSVGVFRRAGFPVEPYPVGWRTAGPGDALLPFQYFSDALRMVDFATREWVGLLIYRLSGRTAVLFPGPQPPCDRAAEACRP